MSETAERWSQRARACVTGVDNMEISGDLEEEDLGGVGEAWLERDLERRGAEKVETASLDSFHVHLTLKWSRGAAW